jgi:uncharacterized protein YecE (DUF72 family)
VTRASIHIGTSGWSYKHWKNIYYPEGLAATKWLSLYAKQFKIAEINTSFYRLPKPSTIKNWIEKVPAGFLFCPKMSRYLTQFKKLNDPEEPLERFFDVFAPMYNIMGPVLVQLPPTLGYHRENVEFFYTVLKKYYNDFLFAIEIRHKSWLSDESLTLMKQYHIAFVISQSKDKFPYAEQVTAKHVYVRFHGPDALYASQYSDKQLRYYAKLFLEWKKEGRNVYAFFNNDVQGYAFRDAQRLIDIVERKNNKGK